MAVEHHGNGNTQTIEYRGSAAMSDYAGWLNSGSTGPEALGKLWAKLFTAGFPLALTPTAYQVTQRQAGTNMSVDIAIGTGLVNLTDYVIPVWSSATINETVTAADPSNPRNDIVVVYIDLTAYGANNNLGATKFLIVSGVPSGTPSDPSDTTIQSAVGTGNPWTRLARITLPANATSVVDAYITDLRAPAAFAGNLWGGTNNTKGHLVPNVADDTVALLAAAQTLQNKTIDGGTNTFTNLPASSLNNPYKFSVYQATQTTIPNATWTKVGLQTKLFDTGSNFDATTNSRFTAPVAGFYQFNGVVTCYLSGTTAENTVCALYKNGSTLKNGSQITLPTSPANAGTTVSGLFQLAAGDYVELWVYQAQGSSGNSLNGEGITALDGFLVSKT